MTLKSPTPDWRRGSLVWVAAMLLHFAVAASEQNVILHLKNGDRIAGTIVSQDATNVVITTPWIQKLTVPVSQIESRETPPVVPVPAPATNPAPATAAAPPATNAAPAAKLPETTVAAKPLAAPKPKRWKGEARVGLDFLQGAKEQQNYYGRLKLTYERPYESNPKHFFRNIFDYAVDYGRTDGVLSANRMDGSDKTDFDIGPGKFYVYNLARVGYDKVRLIDVQYEVGPGLGYHVLTKPAFILNSEAGMNYQVQERSDNTRSEHFYYRLAQDVTWKPLKQLTLTEKCEFFPQVNLEEYRARLESTVSYGFWQNLSLNLSLLNLYDTQPASGVPNNDLQIRSSLGITF